MSTNDYMESLTGPIAPVIWLLSTPLVTLECPLKLIFRRMPTLVGGSACTRSRLDVHFSFCSMLIDFAGDFSDLPTGLRGTRSCHFLLRLKYDQPGPEKHRRAALKVLRTLRRDSPCLHPAYQSCILPALLYQPYVFSLQQTQQEITLTRPALPDSS